jgi:RHS repeat-associated protein
MTIKGQGKKGRGTMDVAKGPHKSPAPMPMAKKAGKKTANPGDKKNNTKKKKAKRGTSKKNGKKVKEKKAGHPVDVFSGAVIDQDTDFALAGLIEVVFTRCYSSHWGTEGLPFGRCGWTHGYYQLIERVDPPADELPEEWRLRDEDGGWLDLGALPKDQRVYLRGGQLDILRRETTLEIHGVRSRLTRHFDRTTSAEPYRLVAMVGPRGHRVRFEWSGARLEKIIDTAGREIRCQHDDRGRIVRVGIWVGGKEHQWVDFGYHDAGELAWARNALGHESRFQYDGLHRLTTNTLRNGVSFHYEYGQDGRCVRTYGDQGLHTWVFQRNDQEREVVCTGTAESQTFRFDAQGNLIEEKTIDGLYRSRQTYDDDGLVLEDTDGLGRSMRFEYDERGHLVKYADRAGNETTREYEDDLTKRVVDAAGHVIEYQRNRFGQLVGVRFTTGDWRTFEYDDEGRLETVHCPSGLHDRYTYDAQNNVVGWVDRRGSQWGFEYDALGRPVARRHPSGHVEHLTLNALGKAVEVTDVRGGRTLREYDSMGNVCRVVDPQGREVKREFGGTGKLTRQIDATGAEWRFRFDRDERLIEITNPMGEEHLLSYDRAGLIEREETFDGRVLTYRYDAAGQLRRITRPDDTFREFSYDPLGNVVEESSTHGAQIFERDKLGHALRAVVEDGPEEIEVTLERDGFGRVLKDVQAGVPVEYAYDTLGRRTARRVLGETTNYRYDAFDQIVAVEHEGRVVEITRDRRGRETRRLWNGTTAIDSLYDPAGALIEQRVLGPSSNPATGPEDPGASHSLGAAPEAYAAWKVLSHRRWTRDSNGKRISEIDRIWGTTHYHYDPAERLLGSRTARLHETFDYDPTGSVVAALRTMADPRLAEPRGRWRLGKGNVLLEDDRFTYELDACHRRTARIDKKTGERTEYLWDVRDRLREVKRPDGVRIRFFYDAFNRRVRKEVIQPTEASVERAMAIVRASVDGHGDVPAMPEVGVTRFAWDGSYPAAEEVDHANGSGTSGRKRVYVDRRADPVPLLQSEQGRVFHVITDPLGVPRELVDEEGAVASSVAHGAWGDRTQSWSPPGAPVVESPFRMLGQYHDADSSLAMTRFRCWEPETARWLSPDPLGLPGGLNPFAFEGAPTVLTDPLGLCPEEYGISSIAEQPELLKLWEQALEKTGEEGKDNAYTRLQEMIANGEEPTNADLAAAFGAVNKKFLELARAADPDCDIAQVHHWNYPKSDYPDQVFDPNNLFPVDSRALHEQIHQDTTSNPSKPWAGPISPDSELPL